MDNTTVNEILKAGLNEIDDELALHESIREISKELTTRILWNRVLDADIMDEFGREEPYLFVLKPDRMDPKTGVPVIAIEVTNVYKLEEVFRHNNTILGGNCMRYTPAIYEAPMDSEHSKEQIIQTLLATAIARIKGILMVEESDDDEE